MTGQMDLFAGDTDIPQQRPALKPVRGTTNDMDLIESVLRTAIDPGYVVIGAAESVHLYCGGPDREVERAPSYESDAVHQLVDQKLLTIGGVPARVTREGEETRANSVLVSRKARGMASRWRSYKRPESWGAKRHAAVEGKCSCGAPAVEAELCMDCIDVPNLACEDCGYRHEYGGPCPY
ncbi:MAG: hypothetical protein ACRDTT_26455 [Pseudonocardiaceae bacterium]